MFNSYNDAKRSAEELSNRLNSLIASRYPDLSELIANTSVAHVAYNQDEAVFLQLLEVYIQKMGADAFSFFRYLIDISQAPEWFRLAAMKLIAKIADPWEIDDSDLRNHVNQYERHIKEGDGVIVVAHSQGNIYAMAASDHVGDNRLEVYGVASPIKHVFGTHTTLHSDWLIKLIPNSSSPNVRNKPEGFFDHEFIRHYLDGNESGPMILSKTACLLSLYRKKPTPNPMDLKSLRIESPKKHQSCIDVPKDTVADGP